MKNNGITMNANSEEYGMSIGTDYMFIDKAIESGLFKQAFLAAAAEVDVTEDMVHEVKLSIEDDYEVSYITMRVIMAEGYNHENTRITDMPDIDLNYVLIGTDGCDDEPHTTDGRCDINLNVYVGTHDDNRVTMDSKIIDLITELAKVQ
jgi:hypothetical protein